MSGLKHSKRYRTIEEKLVAKLKSENTNKLSVVEALKFLQTNNQENSKSIEIVFSLYWNKKKQPLSTELSLPHFTKKYGNIAVIGGEESVFDKSIDVEKVKLISVEDLNKKIQQKKSKWGFEKIVAHSQWQDKIKHLARILGPKKMFPSVKNGTLTEDLASSIKNLQKGKVEIRTDVHGNIHTLLGDTNRSLEQLEENYRVLSGVINNLKPTNWKGEYLRSVTLSTAMGPGIRVTS